MTRLTAGSVFSGIGGLDLAASVAGFDILYQCDNDEFCRQVLRKWRDVYWKNSVIYGDIRELGRGRYIPRVDVLFGGFPCQDISTAGKGAGLSGERSGLWWEMWRIIRDTGPRAIVLENVAAITYEGRGGVEVVGSLAKIGYECRWAVVSASDAGAPHRRQRWFLVGYANGKRFRPTRHSKRLSHKKRYMATGQRQQKRFTSAGAGAVMVHATRKRREKGLLQSRPSKRDCATGSQLVYPTGEGLEGQKHSQFRGSTQSGWARAKSKRVPKPRMARGTDGVSARMDGHQLMSHEFPNPPGMERGDHEPPLLTEKGDHWKERVKATGNAVVPQVVYPIFAALYEKLSSERL